MGLDFIKFIKAIVVRNELDMTKEVQLQVSASATTATKTILQSEQTANRTVTLPDATDTIVGRTTTDTLTNKTLTSPIINGATGITKADVGLGNVDNTSDATKNSATATLTNKTLSGNTATNFINGSGTVNINSSGTITLPNATDTLVGKATTDTLTNKSLTSPSLTTPSITGTTTSNAGITFSPSLIASLQTADSTGANSKAIRVATGGASAGFNSGAASILTGTGDTTGLLTIRSGDATVQSGALNIKTGDASGSGNSGNITIGTGSVSSGTKGTLTIDSPSLTGNITTPLTASKAVVLNGSSQLIAATTTATEIGYVNGVTSAIQTQLDAKALASLFSHGTFTPTLSGVANVNTVTLRSARYIKVGNQVFVTVTADVIPDDTLFETTFSATLPVASNFANTYNCTGVVTGSVSTGYVNSEPTGDVAYITFFNNNGAEYISAQFSYTII